MISHWQRLSIYLNHSHGMDQSTHPATALKRLSSHSRRVNTRFHGKPSFFWEFPGTAIHYVPVIIIEINSSFVGQLNTCDKSNADCIIQRSTNPNRGNLN